MRRLLVGLSVLHFSRVLRSFALAERQGTASDKVIHRPERLGAQPTRYQPSPGKPARGKRRRQWR